MREVYELKIIEYGTQKYKSLGNSLRPESENSNIEPSVVIER